MTEMIRNMHKERIIGQLNQGIAVNSARFTVAPDFASLLSRKFSSFNEEENELGADLNGSLRNEPGKYYSTEIEPKN